MKALRNIAHSSIPGWRRTMQKSAIKYWDLYLLVAPVLVWLILFKYRPMYGTVIAFQDFSPRPGDFGQRLGGIGAFRAFFSRIQF